MFGLRRGNRKGISNASDLRLHESGDVVVLLLRHLQHNRVQVQEELSDSCHNDVLAAVFVEALVLLLFDSLRDLGRSDQRSMVTVRRTRDGS